MVAISARNSLTRSEMRCDRMASAPIPQTRLSFCSTPNCATQRIGTWLAQLRPGLCGEEVRASREARADRDSGAGYLAVLVEHRRKRHDAELERDADLLQL